MSNEAQMRIVPETFSLVAPELFEKVDGRAADEGILSIPLPPSNFLLPEGVRCTALIVSCKKIGRIPGAKVGILF